MKRIIAALAALTMLTACLASCQLSELIDKPDPETTPADGAETTTPAGSETTAVEKYDAMDFTEVDPLQYITLGDYKGIDVTVTREQVTDEAYDAAIKALLEEIDSQKKK